MKVDPAKTHLFKEFKHDAPLLACAFDRSGRFVFTGGRDRLVHRWEIATGKKSSLESHETWVGTIAAWHGEAAEPNTAAQQDDRDMLFTGDYAGRVAGWSLADDLTQVKWTIDAHQGTVRSVTISPDGKLLATGGRDGKVRLWATDTGKSIGELSGHAGQVYGVAFHPEGRLLASGDRHRQRPAVRLWDLTSQREVGKLDASDLSAYRRGENIEWGGVRDLAFSPDGNVLACCGRHKYAGPASVLLFNHGARRQTEKLVSTFKAIFHRVKLHPNGFVIAAGAAIKSGELWFWDLQDDQPIRDKDGSTADTSSGPLATINVSGPANDFDLHPGKHQIVVAQSRGKSTYPDGGAVGIYDMTAKQDTETKE